MKLAYKIGIPIVILTALAVFVSAIFTRKSLEANILRETFLVSQESVLRDSKIFLSDEVLSDPFGVLSQTKFKEFNERVRNPSIARLTIWSRDHVVLHSDLQSIIGQRAPDHPDLARLFAQGSSFFLQKEKDTNTPIQSNVGEILDIYIPLSFSGKVIGAVEIQTVIGAVLQPIRQTIAFIQYVRVATAGLSLGFFFLVIFIFVLKPIALLSSASRAIQEGNLDYAVTYKSKDEIGAFAASFESMRLRLFERTKELQKAVEQVAQFGVVADKERNLYLLLLSSIGEGVFVLDLDRKVTTMNKAAEGILGFAKEELVGKRFDTVLTFIHKDKTLLEHSFWEQAYQEKKSKVLPPDISVITKSGAAIPIADVVSPVIDTRTHEIVGLVVTFRDVREERSLEEARLGFIATASHQLRTPLTSMRWFLEMLTDGDAGAITKAQAKFVDRVYQGTGRMIGLINLLLQIARVEAGRVKIEPVPIDFKNLVHEIAVALGLPDGKSQKVEVTAIPDPFPQIPMDKEVIWQVFQNLISNASRYSPKKSVIHLSMAKKDGVAEFAIKDKGIGIPKDQQHRIFEKFFRADNALTLVPEGSGLGLSLVKTLVEAWGGKIWFESVEGQGTTFYFTVPLEGMKAKEGEVALSV